MTDTNTHRAVISSSVPPSMEVIAAGDYDFCFTALESWIEKHPLNAFQTGLVVAIQETIDPRPDAPEPEHVPYEDLWRTNEMVEWGNRVRDEMVPKMKDSSFVLGIQSGKTDVKIAVETGYAILLDKPLITCVLHGAEISEKLRLVSDEIISVDMGDTAGSAAAMTAAVDRIVERRGGGDV